MTIAPLFHREYGNASPGAPALLLLHGLFGSSANWHGIARRLADHYRILVPDLRNHGRSGWSTRMSYEAMSEDLIALMDHLDCPRASVVGHSMGGKAAMWLALTEPRRIDKLVVADIAPVRYRSRFSEIIAGLNGLNLADLKSREQADSLLGQTVPEQAIRSYLLQNLGRNGGAWQWRMNLPVIAENIGSIMDFPATDGQQYPGPVQVIYGTSSNYVQGTHLAAIKRLFPLARLRAIPNAGHWVYADRPDPFVAAVNDFLGARRG